MTTLTLVTRENAPMQLSDFMNLPPAGFNEDAPLYCYEVEDDGDGRVRLANEKSGNRLELLKEAVLQAKSRDEGSMEKWGSYLEFGVGSGKTVNFIAAIADNTFVYGFESGNGIGDNAKLQERPFAYTKTLDQINSQMNGDFSDEYGNNGQLQNKQGLIKLALKPRVSENEQPFVPFTPLCNLLLYMGDIEETLPAYLQHEIKKKNRPDHVSFIFIDTGDAELTDKIVYALAGFVSAGKTIVVTDHALGTDAYTPSMLANENDILVPLTQDTVGLRLSRFIQPPYKTNSLANDDVNTFISPGRNVLHFNSKNRKADLDSNKTMVQLLDRLKKANAVPLMSDSEVLQHGIKTAHGNFADQEGTTKFFLEFGVCSGRTINFIATLLDQDEQLFGFEGGTGLPETWRTDFPKGMFRYTKKLEKNGETGAMLFNRIPFSKEEVISLDKQAFIPFIPHERVKLVMGLIENTLDDFIDEYLEPLNGKASLAFVHVDTDLESAAKIILKKLKKYIEPKKTVIIFDEAFNFKGAERNDKSPDEWKNHEYRALNLFKGPNAWHPIAYNQNGQQLAVIFGSPL